MPTLSDNLVLIRQKMDLSWRKFAVACGVSLSSIQDYINKKHEPSQRNLRKISDGLDIPVSELIGEKPLRKITKLPPGEPRTKRHKSA